MLSIAVLFIVAKGIETSGGLEYVSKFLFSAKTGKKSKSFLVRGSENSIVWVLLKFTVPVALFSAFLANIPLVAMMIPPIVEFSKKVNISPSKMLIPLSYAALLGGTLTLIGASTNLMVTSMAAKKLPELTMNIFEIGIVGVPTTVAGILYLLAFSGKLLPDRLAMQATNINAREYTVVLVVKPSSSLCRKSVEQTGVQNQPGLQLLHVDRDGVVTSDPPSDFIVQAKDKLHFCGVIDSILSLTQLDGLTLSEDEGQEQVDLDKLRPNQFLVEAVVASKSPMVHKRVIDLQLRTRYKAAIVAVHRYGTRLNSAIGDIVLEAGDSLLLVADGSEFVCKHRNNSTFALVSKLPGFTPVQRQKAGIAAIFVLTMVVASAFPSVPLITAALFTSAALMLSGSMTSRDAMDSLELPVLIMIAAAFGISEALVQSGAADLVAQVLMGLSGGTQIGLLTCTYVATTVFSLAITNNAAVTIMFPVALAAAQQQGLDFRPFAYILMMASSAGLMTPTGCATNIMVYNPGGYKFVDYIAFGGPLQIVLLIVTVGVTLTLRFWWIWWTVLIGATVFLTPILARQNWNLPHNSPSVKQGDSAGGLVSGVKGVKATTGTSSIEATAAGTLPGSPKSAPDTMQSAQSAVPSGPRGSAVTTNGSSKAESSGDSGSKGPEDEHARKSPRSTSTTDRVKGPASPTKRRTLPVLPVSKNEPGETSAGSSRKDENNNKQSKRSSGSGDNGGTSDTGKFSVEDSRSAAAGGSSPRESMSDNTAAVPSEEVLLPVAGMVGGELAAMISSTRACLYEATEFFVAWQGVLTVAYSGIPPALCELKDRMGGALQSMVPENPGSRWPKTTLACLRDDQRLTPEQLSTLRDICSTMSFQLALAPPVVVNTLSVVLYENCCLEKLIAATHIPLQHPVDPSPPSLEQRQYVRGVVDEFGSKNLAKYWLHASKDGNRSSHYRKAKMGATVVHFLAPHEMTPYISLSVPFVERHMFSADRCTEIRGSVFTYAVNYSAAVNSAADAA
ncbi:unnamed protein product [Closterium sp. NIES-54]